MCASVFLSICTQYLSTSSSIFIFFYLSFCLGLDREIGEREVERWADGETERRGNGEVDR